MKIWKSLTESGGFHRFTSLRILAISGCDEDMVSFPLEDIGLRTTLSASLTQLEIFNCPNLESLSSSICDQNLTSLSEAEILSKNGPACLAFAIRDREVSTDRKKVQTGQRTILALGNPYILCLNKIFLYCKLSLIAKQTRTGLDCINSWVLCISCGNLIFILCRIMCTFY